MTITLTPEQQRIVDEQLRSGRYRTPADVVGEALRSLRESDLQAGGAAGSYREAVREMLRFAEANRVPLHDVSVKQLIHEGHRL